MRDPIPAPIAGIHIDVALPSDVSRLINQAELAEPRLVQIQFVKLSTDSELTSPDASWNHRCKAKAGLPFKVQAGFLLQH